MSEQTLMIVIVTCMVLAFGLGIWIGLGYPGLYEKYEPTGKAPRQSPFSMLVGWLAGLIGGGRRPPPSARSRRKFLGDRDRRRGGRP